MPSIEFKVRLGLNLQRARKQAGLSQEALSFRAGLHRTAVSQLERGIRIARADTLVRLAGALEIPVGSLLDGLAWTPGSYEPGWFAAKPTYSHGSAARAVRQPLTGSGAKRP